MKYIYNIRFVLEDKWKIWVKVVDDKLNYIIWLLSYFYIYSCYVQMYGLV